MLIRVPARSQCARRASSHQPDGVLGRDRGGPGGRHPGVSSTASTARSCWSCSRSGWPTRRSCGCSANVFTWASSTAKSSASRARVPRRGRSSRRCSATCTSLGQGSVRLLNGGAEWWKSPCSDLRGPGRATARATRPTSRWDYLRIGYVRKPTRGRILKTPQPATVATISPKAPATSCP